MNEFVAKLEVLLGRKLPIQKSKIRPGDQPIYVSDITKLHDDLNWKPRISVDEGMSLIYDWVKENIHLFKDTMPLEEKVAFVTQS